MKKHLSTLLLLFLVGMVFGQNTPPPSLYLMNQSMLNPAYNGINDQANITAISRGQWVGVPGSPYTHTLAASSTFSDHSAGGLLLVRDSYGINSDTEIMFSYAYRIDMLGSYLSFGLQGGIISHVSDFTKLDQEDFSDTSIGSSRQSTSSSNFGFGLMYKNDIFYLGIGSPKLSAEDLTVDGVQNNSFSSSINLTGGLLITPLDFFKIKPSFLVSYTKEGITIDLNGQILIDEKIWLGASLRNLTAPGVNIIYTEDAVYHFGYSFQFPLNQLGTSSWGTHELMLSIDMRLSKRHQLKGRFF